MQHVPVAVDLYDQTLGYRVLSGMAYPTKESESMNPKTKPEPDSLCSKTKFCKKKIFCCTLHETIFTKA